MLPTVDDPAVLELEDEAAVDIQVLAVSFSAVAMKGEDVAIIVCSQVPQLGPKGPSGLASQLTEVGKRGVTTFMVASQRAAPRRVPRQALVCRRDSVSVSMSPVLKAS